MTVKMVNILAVSFQIKAFHTIGQNPKFNAYLISWATIFG